MASKRSISPGPIDIMKEIMKLIAEPSSNSVNNKKKIEVDNLKHPGKVINHDYCDECSGGGEIICCDKCPKSYHLNCHIPTVNKPPDGEWFCKGCTYIENDDFNHEVPIINDNNKTVNKYTCQYDYTNNKLGLSPPSLPHKCMTFTNFSASMKKIMESESQYYLIHGFLNEIPIQRKYNVKLPTRKQLDKQKMIRKTDRCCVCKRCVLRGRLIQCHYCCRLYHLNCLDPPIRDWDHSTRWICPAHEKFYELAYPEYFTPNCRTASDVVTMKRQRCELSSLPVNTFFNIPSHIDAMYKMPEENIPTTSNENSYLNILCNIASFELESINSNKINKSNIVSNDISTQFLARQCPNKVQKKNVLLPKQPTASLSCLSIPNKIFIHNTLTIGKSSNNNLCLLPCGNCDYVSDYHATITFDDKLGDYLVKNHSRYGIIVDNISYFGKYRPKDLSNNKLKQINCHVKQFINKRRRYLHANNDLFRFYQKNGSGRLIIKYVTNNKKFNYRSMYKYVTTSFKNTNNNFRQIQCKCLNRLLPKDGYAEQAVLRNGSIISIGCIQFKFTCDSSTKVCNNKSAEVLISNRDESVRTILLNEVHSTQFQQEEIVSLNNGIRSDPVLFTINEQCPLEDVVDTDSYKEQNNISTFNLNNFDYYTFSNDDNTIDSGVSDNIILHNNNEQPLSDINLSSLSEIACINWDSMNGVPDNIESCFTDDLVHEVEINNLTEEGVPIEETVYVDYINVENSTSEHITEVQDWLIEEIVIADPAYNDLDFGPCDRMDCPPSTEPYLEWDNNGRDSKTEHLYSSSSTHYNESVVISDNEDGDS